MTATGSSELLNRLSREIAQLPDSVKLATRQGFEIAAGLSEPDRRKAVELILAAFEGGGGSFDAEILSGAMITLSRRDAGRVATALSIVIALLTQHAVTAEDFLQAARGNVCDASSEATVRAMAELVISQRRTLTKAMERQRLENVVLPSLTEFSVAVDVRVRFTNEKPEEVVAVAVAHIDTDGSNQEMWCQLSRADVKRILEKLQNTAQEMEVVEELMKKIIPDINNRQ